MTTKQPEDGLGRWPIAHEINVQWGDMDALGHVNNLVYLRWFENARIHYFEALGLRAAMDARTEGPILARQEIDYKIPVSYPERVRVATTVTRLGNTSFTVAFRIVRATTQELVAEGAGVMVMVEYATGRKLPLSDELRRAVLAFEARAG
jgi:acyl-CoA thioester hydrolase